MQNDHPPPKISITAEELRSALDFSKQHRNPIITQLRKRKLWSSKDLDDELRFYEILIAIVEDPEQREILRSILKSLATNRRGRPNRTYCLRFRVLQQAVENRSAPDNAEAFGDLPQWLDGKPLPDIDSLPQPPGTEGEPPLFWRVLKWLEFNGMIVPASTGKSNSEAIMTSTNNRPSDEEQLSASDATSDAPATWHGTIDEIRKLLESVGETPDLGIAEQLAELSAQACRAAEAYADDARIDSARANLQEALKNADELDIPSLSSACAALETADLGPVDVDRLTAWQEEAQRLIAAAHEARAAYMAVDQELEVAYRAKDYDLISAISTRAANAKKQCEAHEKELDAWIASLCEALSESHTQPQDGGSTGNDEGQTKDSENDRPQTSVMVPAAVSDTPEPADDAASSEASHVAADQRTATEPEEEAFPSPPDNAAAPESMVSSQGEPASTDEIDDDAFVPESTPSESKSTASPVSEAQTGPAVSPAATAKDDSVRAEQEMPSESISDEAATTALWRAVEDGRFGTDTSPGSGTADEPTTAAISRSERTAQAVPETDNEAAGRSSHHNHEADDFAKFPTSDFSVDTTVAFLAERARGEHGDGALPFVNGFVWRLLLDDRGGLAAHLADTAQATYGEGSCEIPPVLLHAVALAEHLGSPTGESALRLRDLLSSLFALGFDKPPIRKQKLLSLYGIAATLRPSLVAPVTTAAHELLQTIHLDDDLRALHQLRGTLLDHRRSGITQNPAFLRTAREYGEWQDQVSTANKAAENWWVSNRHKTFKYSHATRVWHHWLEPEQPLGRLINLITGQDPDTIDEARSLIDQWSKQSEVESQIQQADDLLRGRKAKLRPIEGSAKQDLIRHVREPLDLGRRWLEVMEANPGTVEDSVTRQARALRDRIQSIAPNCIQELAGLTERSPDSLQTAAAVHVAKKAVNGFLQVLREGSDEMHLSPVCRVNADLLHLPDPPATDDWAPAEPIGLDALLGVALKGNRDWAETLSNHGRQCRHHITERLLSYLEACRLPGLDLDTLDREREETLQRCRAKLEDRVEEIRNRIEGAVAGDQLPEAERLGMIERLETASNLDTLDIRANLDALAGIEMDIDRRRNDHVREIRGRLKSSGLEERQPEVAARIESLLLQGDTLTADEYIALAETGQDLPEDEPRRDPFLTFFPDQVSQLNHFLRDNSQVKKAIEAIRERQNIGPLQMARVPGTQAMAAAKMLEAWILLKNRQGDTQGNLNDLLTRIGFQVEAITLEPARPQHPLWVDLRVQPLKEREICPIPRYGSLAQGHYRLLCVWKAVTEDEILALTNLQGRDVPTIVLYLARMTETRRRDLAHLCLERRRTVIVVDETLIFSLCTERGLRLGTLFQCAFPFTTDNPYTIASSNVPVEMFFGRQLELESLLDTFGSNLVYGGRQLGKTALLREVERRHHDPEEGFIIRWIDLKAEGIGLDRPSSELWEVIGSTLRADKIVHGSVSRRETVSEQIIMWLNADHHRRILLLLDEADAFLSDDGRDKERGYKTIAYLKDLMDRTSRRFKIVLAGLHNVQRSARDVNTPIAHMGQPVCIGPLLENGEVREAMRLVTLPFYTLGFRFEPDVASRILSHTNYYPSLIQIFCRHLLDVLNDTFRQPIYRGCTPPYVITAKHIEEAYQRKELRNAIADRFRFTLELDGRYRIIALRIALETLERRAEGRDTVGGYEVEWLRNETLELWPLGFPDSSFETFRTLLDEMIGLGILRRAGLEGNRYALRSPNVISLLGTQNEIMESLLDAADKEPPLVYEAATYRRFFAGDPWHRSPLTGQQESQILASEHGVSVLFGMSIAGLGRVQDFLLPLKKNLSAVDVIELPMARELRELEAALDRAFQGLDDQHEGVVLLMVDKDTPWTDSWVQAMAKTMKARRTKRVHYRVLFSGDPAAAWRWVTMADEQRQAMKGLPVSTLALQPWHDDAVRRWMEDAGFGPVNDRDKRTLFTEVTGNWGKCFTPWAIGSALIPLVGKRRYRNSERTWSVSGSKTSHCPQISCKCSAP